MIEATKTKIKIFAAIVFVVMVLLIVLVDEAEAGGGTVTNNYYTETSETMTITNGLSSSDINSIVTGTLAGGSHQFGLSTTHWQLSATGATTTDDWEEDTNFSFAVAKRWGKHSWIPNALFHVEFTPDIAGNDYVHFGGTIVLQ